MYAYVHACTWATVCMKRSEGNLWEFTLSFQNPEY